MGTSVTEKQVSSLKRLNKNINVVLALDADTAGEEAMLRCVGYENSLDAEVKVIILAKDKDPDDVIKEDTKTWQNLLEEALPVIDYTFNMLTSKLDLTTAKDKSSAISSLLPIIDEIKDDARRDHYLTKLSKLTGISYRSLENALSRIKSDRRTKEPRAEAVAHAVQPLRSSPLEEHCLALLLQHPELKESNENLLPEHFENSENLEIFIAWQQDTDLPSLKDKLDTTIWEHLDTLINKSIPANQIEQRYADYVRSLRERYFKNFEAKRAEIFSLEVESGGAGADLARLEEEGIEPAIQLREIHHSKSRKRSEAGR